jgi:hypothetical protein
MSTTSWRSLLHGVWKKLSTGINSAFGKTRFILMMWSLTHGAEPFVRSRKLCSYSKTSQHFMEPEGSLPCPQEPSTDLYLQPDRSSSYHSMVDKVALGQVFSEYLGFPCQFSFHQLLQKSSSSIIWGLYNRPKWQQYQGLRYIGTQSHPTNNNNNNLSKIHSNIIHPPTSCS